MYRACTMPSPYFAQKNYQVPGRDFDAYSLYLVLAQRLIGPNFLRKYYSL